MPSVELVERTTSRGVQHGRTSGTTPSTRHDATAAARGVLDIGAARPIPGDEEDDVGQLSGRLDGEDGSLLAASTRR